MDKRRLPFGGLEYAALAVLLLFLFAGLLAPWIMPYAPDQINMEEVLKAPGAAYLLGTDPLGRDILSRLIMGARISIGFAVITAFCTMGVGLAVGILSGWCGGKVDAADQIGRASCRERV